MKSILIWKCEDTGLYTIEVDGAIEFECLAADEVREVVNEIMEVEGL